MYFNTNNPEEVFTIRESLVCVYCRTLRLSKEGEDKVKSKTRSESTKKTNKQTKIKSNEVTVI